MSTRIDYPPTKIILGMPPAETPPARTPGEEATRPEKVNYYHVVGRCFIVAMAMNVIASSGLVAYTLLFRVSMMKPLVASLVSTAVLGVLGELCKANGEKWSEIDLGLQSLQSLQDRIKNIPTYFQTVQSYLPGFKNEGNTCFINASVQALLAIPLYRQAILDTAQKEAQYHASWLKICRYLDTKKDDRKDKEDDWTLEDVKGFFICLARDTHRILKTVEENPLDPKKINVKTYLTRGASVDNADNVYRLCECLEQFEQAHQREGVWPDLKTQLADLSWESICSIAPRLQRYFKNSKQRYISYQRAFRTLQQLIPQYEERLHCIDCKTDSFSADVQLSSLRVFISSKGAFSYRQEDAEEFIIQLLSWVRRCEHSDLFVSPKELKHLKLFKAKNPSIADQVARARAEKIREDHVPENNIISRSLDSPIIQVGFPPDAKTGQHALNAWMFTENPVDNQQDNLFFYQEGDYCIFKEEHCFEELPASLIVSLKRFEFDRSKASGSKISDKLPFSQTVVIQHQEYRIVAIITHHNEAMDVGHYTALIKDVQDYWWHCDNQWVEKATSETLNVGLEEGYLYFLEKKSSDTTDLLRN